MSAKAEPKRAKYLTQVAAGLQATYDDHATEVQALDLAQARLVVFSDQHKGARDRADDFQACERAYNAALAYHFELGYRLIVLGDVEELWECRPGEVLRCYNRTFELEAPFHKENRYERFWGDHDDLWRYGDAVRKQLSALYAGPPLRVREALKLDVNHNDQRLGELFLVHGHQGTLASDRFGWFSRLVVRYGWRNIQRLTGWRLNTPARDFRLRGDHDWAMYKWAESKPDTILVAGHTHRPVFESRTHYAVVEQEIAAFSRKTNPTADDRRKLAELRAELEFTRGGQRQGGDTDDRHDAAVLLQHGVLLVLRRRRDWVRDRRIDDLVRWPDDDGRPARRLLGESDLVHIFAELGR